MKSVFEKRQFSCCVKCGLPGLWLWKNNQGLIWIQTSVSSFRVSAQKYEPSGHDTICSFSGSTLSERRGGRGNRTTFVVNLALLSDESSPVDLWHLSTGCHVLEVCCIMWMWILSRLTLPQVPVLHIWAVIEPGSAVSYLSSVRKTHSLSFWSGRII